MRQGVLIGLTAYVLWGLSPIFWKLGDGGATTILTLRVAATVVLLLALHLLRDGGADLRAAARRPGVLRAMLASATLLAVNWLAFIWAVTNERVLETSLGYFLNPLVSVLLGVTVLRERLRPAQWSAVVIAAVGVAWLSIDLGSLPWISLLLAGSFGLYGLIRKTAPVEAFDGLTIEVVAMTPFALVGLVGLSLDGAGATAVSVPWGWVWVAGTALMTSIPLLLFATAARRIDLSLVGILQYAAPSLQFLLGVLVYGEEWSGGQVVGYAVIWVGCIVFAVEGVRYASRRRPAPSLRPA